MSVSQAQKPIGKAGMAFFGSLCLGTFGLGVWQTKKYFDKIEQIEERDRKMALAPTQDIQATEGRILIKGTFDHDKEFYVGPRGSPIKKSTGSIGVPNHGYFVWTPLMLTSVPGEVSAIVNRGWVPREMVDNDRRRGRAIDDRKEVAWSRPQGEVELTVVQATPEGASLLNQENHRLTL